MFKREIFGKIFIVLSISFIFLLTGCQGMGIQVGGGTGSGPSPSYKEDGPPPWAPAHGKRAKYTYRYYPSSRVYFDTGRGLYFYYRDGKWQVSASIPVSVRFNVGNYVTVEMDSDKPYEYAHEVEKKYPPGQLKKKDKKKGWKK